MTSDGTNTYTWDARNQLASISGVLSASFAYGPFGRRQGKTINGTTTNFLYDGVNPIQELSGTTVNANLLTGGVDEYFTRTDALGTSNFLTDALGSTVALASSSGAINTAYTFEPFGNATVQGGSNASSYQFTGRENDGDGLYFYRARYYSTTLGRFISEDPAGFAGGISLHAYAGDSPAEFVDPSGLALAAPGGLVPSPASRGCEDCRSQVLTNAFRGFIGNRLIPDFSIYSALHNWRRAVRTSLASRAVEGAVAGSPWAYGRMLQVTASNMMQYPGLVAEAEDAAESAAFWTATGATLASGIGAGIATLSVFSTGADLYAAWRCGEF